MKVALQPIARKPAELPIIDSEAVKRGWRVHIAWMPSDEAVWHSWQPTLRLAGAPYRGRCGELFNEHPLSPGLQDEPPRGEIICGPCADQNRLIRFLEQKALES